MLAPKRTALLLALPALLVLAALAGAEADPAPGQPPDPGPVYEITDLGTLGGPESRAFALNDHGHVAGSADTPELDDRSQPLRRAFLWQEGRMRDLGTLGGSESEAYDINNGGVVVGGADRLRDPAGRWEQRLAFFWHADTRMVRIGPRAAHDTWAVAVNDRNVIVGSRDDMAGEPNLWVLAGGRPRRIYYGHTTQGEDLNDRDQVAGWANVPAGPDTAWVWELTGRRLRLEVQSVARRTGQERLWVDVRALGINDAGDVVGRDREGPFLWHQDRLHRLGILPGHRAGLGWGSFRGTMPRRVNEAGEIVGTSMLQESEETRAVLWRDLQPIDLNTVLPPDSGWVLTEAADINERGQIAGTGLHHGRRRAYLLTPRTAEAAQ